MATSKEAANGMTLVGKAAIAIACTIVTAWAIGVSSYLIGVATWRSAVDSNRWTSKDQQEFTRSIASDRQEIVLQIRQELANIRSSINADLSDIHKIISELPPDPWEDRIRELEKWRIQELERRGANANNPPESLSLN